MSLPELLGYIKLVLDIFGVTGYVSAVVGVIVVLGGVAYVIKTLRSG
jgi:hypothetical protein